MLDIHAINKDKNLFALPEYPLITIYDDNWFVRNDYDILSLGQRQYLVKYFTKIGFKQVTGRNLKRDNLTLHFPRPQSNLAISNHLEKFHYCDNKNFYMVTPTEFAEVVFYDLPKLGEERTIAKIKTLINKCPYNIEWLRDISYASPIEKITKKTFNGLMEYQRDVVEKQFKYKRAL